MAARLEAAFRGAKPAFVAYVTAGFPTLDATVPALVAMQQSGVDVIEVRAVTARGHACCHARAPAAACGRGAAHGRATAAE
jgi:hypothetical protein